jgi:ABC-2 type transport system permease protein
MSTRNAVRWVLWRELLDQRQNRMLWPVYVLMPLLGAALPVLLTLVSAELLSEQTSGAPKVASILASVRFLAAASGLDLERAAALFLMRLSGGYFLLMPLAIVSIAGAYAIVGEKQQRTLEPVLATPIATRDYLLAKLLAVTVPAVLVSWIAALLGALAAAVTVELTRGAAIWPDRYFWVAVFVLAPEVAAITALVCLRVSARMNDAQAANQLTALVLVPALLILFAALGPALVTRMRFLLGACAVGAVLTWVLFGWVRRTFDREEILCRWR